MEFRLHAPYEPTGDQPRAIEELVQGFEEGNQFETLVGVTGSGKTFTMANIIQHVQKPGECGGVFCFLLRLLSA